MDSMTTRSSLHRRCPSGGNVGGAGAPEEESWRGGQSDFRDSMLVGSKIGSYIGIGWLRTYEDI